jgi:hypothetical protein
MHNDKAETYQQPAGDLEMAVQSAFPMIDQIAVQARTQAQRAGTLAMHEYRRKLQGIVLDMQDSVREEGARLAEQIRQAVLLQAEEQALDLVDEFVHGRQAEAENLVLNLLVPEEQSDMLELEEAPEPVAVNEFGVEQQTEPIEATAKHSQTKADSDLPGAGPETAGKTASDFASFISKNQS